MKKVLIYGINQQAESLYKMITTEQQADVVAFIVDRDYFKEESLCGLPVVTSDNLLKEYPSDSYEICVSFGYKNMIHNRAEKIKYCKEMGYRLFTFISKNAIIYTDDIGEGCNIYPGVILSPGVKVGEGSFLEVGCIIAHNTTLGKYNFLAPGVHMCGDVVTGDNCFFGGAAEIINNCVIGDNVFVAAGAKVSTNLSSNVALIAPKSQISEKDAFEIMEKMF